MAIESIDKALAKTPDAMERAPTAPLVSTVLLSLTGPPGLLPS